MSALLLSALAAGSSGQGALYVDDVFSTYLYTGNGSTQTINNGIDLVGKGGLVWVKSRTNTENHFLFDTVRGALSELNSNNTEAQTSLANSLTAFNSSGFSVGSAANTVNTNAQNYASWTFRKAPKFFDVVTYTGNGVAVRQIAHSLGVQAGFVTVKATSTTGDWNSYHRSATGDLKLNATDGQTAIRSIITAADASTFTVSGVANTNGVSYVAYLWAHDPSAEGIIQCGSFTYDGTNPTNVNLGFEPQFVLFKNASATGGWWMFDNMRGLTADGGPAYLQSNTSGAEAVSGSALCTITSTGFKASSGSAGNTSIYLAIRRPNKPPTTGTQVYNVSTASGVVSAGFPVDLHIGATRTGAASNHAMHTRLVGGTREMVTSSAAAEATITDLGFDSMTGLRASLSAGGVNHFFRRAPGFFDVVCFQGNGSIPSPGFDHNLGVPPEFVIIKRRDASTFGWPVYVGLLGETQLAYLNRTDRFSAPGVNWLGAPTATKFFPANFADGGNSSSLNYVAYLFASLPCISKVGSYTGNGSSQTIDCGFSTGARFVLIKRTDSTGDWYVWDTARGIVAANDPHLSLNTTAAEVITDDSIDPASVGFIVNQNAATNVNVTGANYIFLAIA